MGELKGLLPKYKKLVEKYEIYLASAGWNLKNFEGEVYGLKINFIDVNDTKNKTFLELLNQLDGLAYGEKGIPMDKWVAYDMAMLPSAVVGFCSQSKDLSNVTAGKFGNYQKLHGSAQSVNFDEYNGLVPVSEYCAIPTINKDVWIGHTLGVWSGSDGTEDNGLGTLTKLMAMAIYKTKYLIGVAQYDNFSLKVHSKFDDLEILSALTPAHSMPDTTFTYKTKIPKKKDLIKMLCAESSNHPDAASFFLSPSDWGKKKEMQENLLEGKSKYWILKPGLLVWPSPIASLGNELKVPIKKLKC